MVTAASAKPHDRASGSSAWESSTTSPPSPAVLLTTDRYAATGTGEPAYVSGAHAWNGTAATLNTKTASTSTAPSSAMGDAVPASASRAASWS